MQTRHWLAALFAAVLTLTATADTGSNATAQVAATNAALPRLLDLGAGKCVPCKAMAPILEELKKSHAATFTVEFIDVWKDPEAAKPYKIKLIPTQIFYAADGRELFRHQGFMGRDDILAKWKELGVDPGTPAATKGKRP